MKLSPSDTIAVFPEPGDASDRPAVVTIVPNTAAATATAASARNPARGVSSLDQVLRLTMLPLSSPSAAGLLSGLGDERKAAPRRMSRHLRAKTPRIRRCSWRSTVLRCGEPHSG
jgi:hypothetical protein